MIVLTLNFKKYQNLIFFQTRPKLRLSKNVFVPIKQVFDPKKYGFNNRLKGMGDVWTRPDRKISEKQAILRFFFDIILFTYIFPYEKQPLWNYEVALERGKDPKKSWFTNAQVGWGQR